jgi:hypothetical protein
MSDAERSTFLMDLMDAVNATASFIPNGAQGKPSAALFLLVLLAHLFIPAK